MQTLDLPIPRVRVRKDTLLWGAGLIAVELWLVLLYGLFSSSTLQSPLAIRYWLYPFVWINVGLWAIVRTERPTIESERFRWLATGLAVGYFGLLAYAGGLIYLDPPMASGLRVSLWRLPPGWGPALMYQGSVVGLQLMPYLLVGYLALSYLVYVTVADAAESAVSGIVGLFSCVSCTWPVLGSVAAGLLGGGTALAGAVYTYSYDLSVIVFLLTVGLLYWRPTFGEGLWPFR